VVLAWHVSGITKPKPQTSTNGASDKISNGYSQIQVNCTSAGPQ